MPGDGDAALSYEQAVAELETVVQRLEAGNLPLEEALALFERGVALARQCAARLEAAEQQVELLGVDADGRLTLRPLAAIDGEGDFLGGARSPAGPVGRDDGPGASGTSGTSGTSYQTRFETGA